MVVRALTASADSERPFRFDATTAFDAFVEQFNTQRPHEALGMKCPTELYVSSTRPYPATLPDIDYSTHDDVLVVGKRGHLSLPTRRTLHLSDALAGHPVGLREGDDGRWLLTFMTLDLGHYHPDTHHFVPLN